MTERRRGPQTTARAAGLSGAGRRAALWALLLLGCALVAAQTPVLTDLTLFLPQVDGDGGGGGERDDQRAAGAGSLLAELREGPAARLLLIALQRRAPARAGNDGDNTDAGAEAGIDTGLRALADLSDRLAAELRRQPGFTRVLNGRQGDDLGTLERQLQPVFERRYLLSPAVDETRFSAPALRLALQTRLAELGSPLAMFDKRWLAADPTGEFLTLLQRWQPPAQPARRHGVWLDERTGGAGADPPVVRALLLAETAAPGFDIDAQARAVAAVRETFERLRGADHTGVDLAPVRLLISGAGAFAVDARATIREEAQRLSLLATVAVLTLLWLCFRSWRLLALGALPLVGGVLAALAAVGLWFGGIYGVTLAFGVTLLGVAVDYPIHLFSHRETLRRGTPIWPTLWLGVLTSAIGFSAMLFAEVGGLRQLAVFAIVGLLAAAATTRWLLPALLPADGAPVATRAGGPGARTWTRALLAPPPALAWLALALALASGAPLLWRLLHGDATLWQNDLAVFSPVPAGAIALDRELRAALGVADTGQLLLVAGPEPESALVASEALLPLLRDWRERGWIDGFDAAARYLPSERSQRRRRAALPGADALRAGLDAAGEGLPFRAGLFAPFVDAVTATRDGRVTPLRPQALASDSPLAQRIAPLLFRSGGRWLALLPLSGVRDPQRLATALDDWKTSAEFLQNIEMDNTGSGGGTGGSFSATVRYVSLRAEAARLVADFRTRTLERLGFGAALIVGALLLALRSWRRTVLVLLPALLAVLATAGLLVQFGGPLSLFHLVSLLLVLGIGLDYSLFCSRRDDPAGRARTLRSVLICSGSTVAVFGILAGSQLPVLQAIGQTVAIGVGATLLLALTVSQQVVIKFRQ